MQTPFTIRRFCRVVIQSVANVLSFFSFTIMWKLSSIVYYGNKAGFKLLFLFGLFMFLLKVQTICGKKKMKCKLVLNILYVIFVVSDIFLIKFYLFFHFIPSHIPFKIKVWGSLMSSCSIYTFLPRSLTEVLSWWVQVGIFYYYTNILNVCHYKYY